MLDDRTLEIIRRVSHEAAKQGVRETLLSMGIDPNDPIEVQKDMATLREIREIVKDPQYQADMLTLRQWRMSMEAVQKKGITAFALILAIGVCAATWLWLKTKLGIPDDFLSK